MWVFSRENEVFGQGCLALDGVMSLWSEVRDSIQQEIWLYFSRNTEDKKGLLIKENFQFS